MQLMFLGGSHPRLSTHFIVLINLWARSGGQGPGDMESLLHVIWTLVGVSGRALT